MRKRFLISLLFLTANSYAALPAECERYFERLDSCAAKIGKGGKQDQINTAKTQFNNTLAPVDKNTQTSMCKQALQAFEKDAKDTGC